MCALVTGVQTCALPISRRPEAVAAMIDDAAAKGARILAGGGRGEEGGFFFQPTVLADVPLDAKAMIDEPFGPVALIRPFAGDEDAIAEANRLPYGLAAYCRSEEHTSELQSLMRISYAVFCLKKKKEKKDPVN